jgi:hypothetical protein
MGGDGQELSVGLVAYLRDVLVVHANDPVAGVCCVCEVVNCPDWRDAYDRLAAANELMAEPSRWEPYRYGGTR